MVDASHMGAEAAIMQVDNKGIEHWCSVLILL